MQMAARMMQLAECPVVRDVLSLGWLKFFYGAHARFVLMDYQIILESRMMDQDESWKQNIKIDSRFPATVPAGPQCHHSAILILRPGNGTKIAPKSQTHHRTIILTIPRSCNLGSPNRYRKCVLRYSVPYDMGRVRRCGRGAGAVGSSHSNPSIILCAQKVFILASS